MNLEELKAAEAAATPAPWDVDGVGGIQMDGVGATVTALLWVLSE